jgi:hypothetical protein
MRGTQVAQSEMFEMFEMFDIRHQVQIDMTLIAVHRRLRSGRNPLDASTMRAVR